MREPVELAHPIGSTTVDDWLTQEHPTDGSRLELIFGYLHASQPPSGQHQSAGDELRWIIKSALRAAGRTDLYVVTGIGIEISTPWRTALIPDVAVLNTKPIGVRFWPENLVLAVEIWSRAISRADRDTRAAAYADAGVRYFWVVNEDRVGGMTVIAHLLKDGQYIEDVTAGPGTEETVKAAPAPVTFDPAELSP